MDEDLVKRLALSNSTRGAIRLLAAQLPPRDEDLNVILDAVIASADEGAVTSLMLAMVEGGRTIEARLLPSVLPLLRSLDDVSAVSFSASGDVPRALVTAAEQGALSSEREAVMLLIAGWVCLHREPRRSLPPGLISRSRLLAREARGLPMALLALFALLKLTKNQGLKTVLEEVCLTPPPPLAVDAVFERVIDERISNPLGHLPEQAERIIGSEGSVRRAVVKIGRNDPCSCGSGKKYKRCCFDADQERLKHSSDVAGVTRDELDATPEPYLTRERLDSMRAPKIARMRIELIAHELQGPFLERLSLFQLDDALLAAWEKVGWREDLSRAWESCLFEAVRAGRREVVVRLVQLRGARPEDDFVPLAARLMLLEDDPGAWLKGVEDAARRSLMDHSDLSFVDLGYALVEGRLPGLGTLVARGAAAAASPFDAMMLFESISRVRDRLDLPPEDPGDWVLDHIQDFTEGLDEDVGEQLANARRQIDAARAETRRLRVRLANARAQLDRQERLAARETAVVGTPPLLPAAPETSTPELRSRIEELKTALKERHDERNALRRELNEIRKASGTARGPTPTLGSGGERLAAEPDREELALLGEEPTPLQRLRLPVFPSRFAATLASLPDHVGRAAIVLIGKLAAGEPSAFVGMRRLRVRHEICRVRLATDYRLLFRLGDDRVEVLDLIRRRDFERWLKTLV